MTRAYLKLYLLLIFPVMVMAFLPQNPLNILSAWWIEKRAHYEYGAIHPLMEEELNKYPQERWPRVVEGISKNFAYPLTIKKRSTNTNKYVLDKLDKKGYALSKHMGNKTLFYPIEKSDYVLLYSIEGKNKNIDYLEKSTRGFRYFLNKKLKESDDIKTELERVKPFFSQKLSIKKLDHFKEDAKAHAILLEKHVYNVKKGNKYFSFILSDDNKYVVTVEGENNSKKFFKYFRYLGFIFSGLLLAIGAFIWLFLFRKELNTVKSASKLLGQGQFDTQVQLSKGSTLYPIAESFNTMGAKIKALVNDHQDLTNAVSHELKTPLSRLHFALEMQKESKTETERVHYTQKIEDNIASLENLVDELLSYTRMQRQQAINSQSHSLKNWLQKELESFTEYHPNIDITYHLATKNKAFFDKYLMSRALNNILNNAVRYARSDTKTIIKVTAEINEENVLIIIEDNGIGIKLEDYDKIFEPFTQLDKSRQRKDSDAKNTSGYGMGLAITKRIMQRHKGKIVCDKSELGGVKMILSWPCVKQ
jgi:signal transduction histidine kinase